MNARTGSHARFVHDWCGAVFELPEGWRDAASPGRGVALAQPVQGGVAPLGLQSWGALLRSAPVQGVSRPPHTASRDCRNGSPLARAIPCAPAPECGDTREKENTGKHAGKTMHPRNERQPAFVVPAPTRSAASRAGMAGWAGEGGGRFGERREYEAPTLPSTPRQHGMARHHTRQPNKDDTSQLATTQASP